MSIEQSRLAAFTRSNFSLKFFSNFFDSSDQFEGGLGLGLLAIDFLLGLGWFGIMVFNATFNNISVISWRSVLLVEETGIPKKNHRPFASH